MRVNPNLSADLLAGLSISKQQQETALLQLSSGRRVNVPSDDPTIAAVLVQSGAQGSRDDQYIRSVSSIQSELQTADSTLSSVVSTLTRAISLGVQGANGTVSDTNRGALVNELQGIQSQLVSLANLSYQGRFVFGGTKNTTQPYQLDKTQPSGVRYDGNSGTNNVEVGDGFSMQVNLPGSQLFSSHAGDVFQSVQDLITALQTNTGVGVATTAVRSAFDNVTAQRVFYGNAINQLDSQATYLNSAKLQLSNQESTIAGADLAATTTNLVNAQNAQSATLSAAARITQLSLFDYLK